MTPSLAADANRGRVALISGGGTGIGRATAHAFAASGARVAICGRRPEPLEAVREELEASGAECLALPCDVREPEQVEAPRSTRLWSASARSTCWSTTPAVSSRRRPRR